MSNNEILIDMNLINEQYNLGPYQVLEKKQYEAHLLNELSNCQKYEFELNEMYFLINNFEHIRQSLIRWPDYQKYNLTLSELLTYFEDRISMNISMDRKYFFLELQFNFCDSKDKPLYAKRIIEELKLIIKAKLNTNNIEHDLVLKLCMRFMILSQMYNLIDVEFIKLINTEYIQNSDLEANFMSFNNLFNAFFNRYKKENKNPYYPLIVEIFTYFSKQIEIQSQNSNKSYKKLYLIGNIFQKINDYNNKLYFYKKEIDHTIEYFQNMSLDNIFTQQFRLNETMKYSKKIDEYRLKELKSLGNKLANNISTNYNKLFHPIKDNDIQGFFKEFYDVVEKEYNRTNIKERIDYLLFNIFHLFYSQKSYEDYLNTKKDNFFLSFSHTVTNHLGYSYDVKNQNEFSFFHCSASLYNNILFNLDENINWVKTTKKYILKDIDKLQMIDDYKIQFKNAIENFNKKKYIDFVYSAPTLIEIILKKYLSQIDGDFLSIKENSLVDKTLNQIIANLIEDENCYMDKYMLKYFSYVLVDSDGLNIRNNLLHGNYQDGFFLKPNTMFIYIILIYLIRYFRYDQD